MVVLCCTLQDMPISIRPHSTSTRHSKQSQGSATHGASSMTGHTERANRPVARLGHCFPVQRSRQAGSLWQQQPPRLEWLELAPVPPAALRPYPASKEPPARANRPRFEAFSALIGAHMTVLLHACSNGDERESVCGSVRLASLGQARHGAEGVI